MTIPLIDTGIVESHEHEVTSCRMAEKAKHSRFEMKFLQAGSLPDLMSLQNIIAANLPCPEIFMLHDDMYFREIFRLERSVIGVTTEEGLIAYSIIRIPGLADDNLGRDINLPEGGADKSCPSPGGGGPPCLSRQWSAAKAHFCTPACDRRAGIRARLLHSIS